MRRTVDGVLLLDKPPGLSSNAALLHAKRLYGATKAGHTGTLDPLASGLLPICFGDATKFAQALLDAAKRYRATIRFGAATSTGDAEGDITQQAPLPRSREAVEDVLPRFMGIIEQLAPRYSALKHQGRKHYEYARAGVDIPRPLRRVAIHAIELLTWEPPLAQIDVTCAKGTYIRSLAEDLAQAAGSCGHLGALRRIASGPFQIERATTLDALTEMQPEARDALLLPVDSPLLEMERLDVDAGAVRALFQGRASETPDALRGRYRCFGPDETFIGLVEVEEGALRAVRLVRAPDFAL